MKDYQRIVIPTSDGSHSIAVPEAGLTFHSKHGAIQESRHVFIAAGLHYARTIFPDEPLGILEMGFGTGLNAFLTAIDAAENAYSVQYTAIDAYPLDEVTITQLNYPDQLDHRELFQAIQQAPWNTAISIHASFTLHKHAIDLLDYATIKKFHLLYFDAFSPETQPELWTEAVFRKLAAHMYPGGVLVTYCSKSIVRRAMQAAGWIVEKVPGPLGKREIVRATYRAGA